MVAEASTSPHIILNKWFQLNKQEAAVFIEWFRHNSLADHKEARRLSSLLEKERGLNIKTF
jgi:hypothetical protein